MKWLFVLLLSPSVFAGWPATMRLDVTLEEAVWANPTTKLPVRVKLERDHGTWQPLVIADSRRLHQGDHWGALRGEKLGDDGGTFAVALRIEPDPWSKTSGYASYRVTLNKDLSGSWEGEFNGTPVKGAARAVVRPVVEAVASFVRPHLLVRAEELPALKAKAQTEWGKAWLARARAVAQSDPDKSSRAVACGFLYQLTGDKTQAEEARRLIEADVPNWNNVMYVHGAAAGVVQGALAFDLIAETCDAGFRRRMREVFRRKCDYLYYPPVGGFNPNDGSNWSAMYRSALGLAALSVLAEPGPTNIEAVAEQIFEPKPGKEDVMRIVPLESGKNIAEWEYTGPEPVPFGVDAAALKVEFAPFAPLDRKHFITAKQAEYYRNPKLEGGVDFASVTGRRYFTANQLAIMLKVEQAGLYQLEVSDLKMEQVVVALAGHQLNNGDVVRLAPGLYPLKVLASIGVVGNWELVEWYLRFNSMTEAGGVAWVRERQQAAGLAAVLREHLPGIDSDALRWLGIARQRIANWSENALGDHGSNGEGEAYTQHALRCVLPFERGYRNAQGRSLFANERVAAMYPLYTAKTVFGADRVTMPSYGPGGGPIGVDNWARGFFLVRPAERAATLWAWNRTVALADAGKFTMVEGLVNKFDALSAVCQFIDYPAELKEANPAETLPRVAVDQKKGAYVFRNRWQDGDDFVTTFFLDSDPDGGGWRAPDWTDFRIVGLGTEWATRGIAWGNGASARNLPNPRLYGNVLFVPEAWQRGKRGAVTTKFESSPDGSGIVTANLDDVYLGVTDGKTQPSEVTNRRVSDVGVRGTRSLAVDYSGRSGAPCLVAVADQVTGTKGGNVWQFCTLPEHKVTVTATGFTIVAGNGASLVARVVQPAAPKITLHPVTIRHEINYHGRHNQADFKRQVISVAGNESFFVVLTIQKDAAPTVRLEGEVAVVGKRKVRCVGADVVLE